MAIIDINTSLSSKIYYLKKYKLKSIKPIKDKINFLKYSFFIVFFHLIIWMKVK
jgi:hypothetical protein